jgi:hypothetical protein
MNYKITVNCPDNQKLIDMLINAASKAGAGRYRNYSRVALVLKGYETWKTMSGAHPHIGKIGKTSKVKSAKIEMVCSSAKLKSVCMALRKAHPYEEPVINVVKLECI